MDGYNIDVSSDIKKHEYDKLYKRLSKKYEGKGYAEFKADLADIVVNALKPIQERYNELINSKELDDILDEGRDYASKIAFKKISKVYNKIGLGRKR